MGKFTKICAYCSTEYKGRIDSSFCSVSCRSNHWQRNKKALSKPKIEDLNIKHKGQEKRKLYIADKGIGISSYPSIVSCVKCKEKGEIGLFYTGYNQDYIRCDNCGLTFRKERRLIVESTLNNYQIISSNLIN